MTEYISALMVCLQPINLLLIIAMVSLGIVFGAIPGLSATLGIALLLPVTFGLSTETSFVLLLAIWIGGVSGTFISAVLIGIPGSSSAIATCFDGFPMTKNGQAGKALGIGMTASFIGTVGSVALATVLSPVIAEFALHLGPWEYFSLCFCAITLVASLSKGNIFKGIMAAGIGLLMGCIGMDPINGSNRFTFGNIYLSSGISTVAQMLGMFAMCQIIRDSARGEAKMPEADMVDMKGLGVGIRDIVQNIKTIVFAFISGLWIGFLPGMGSGISNMVAYGYAKSISKDPESFGKGNPAGVWASETANNASLGGALIPMMALGIPGDGITAMLIAGLTIHGLQAGPLFMTEQPDLDVYKRQALDAAPYEGAALAAWCFSGRLGIAGEYLVSGSMVVFAFATIMAWFYLGRQAAAYFIRGTGLGERAGTWFAARIYPVLFLGAVFLGSEARLDVVWMLSDIWNGLMAFPNLTALLFLYKEVTLPEGFRTGKTRG